MAAAPEQSTGGAGGLSLTTTSGIMIAVIMLLLALFLLVFFLYLRRKQCWGAIPAFGRPAAVRLGPDADPAAAAVLPGGLDAVAIEALPSCVFRLEGAAEGMECAVCISELADGEPARLLPKCGHGFHLECVDMWLRSHSTCPVCRCSVVPAPPGSGGSGADAGVRPLEAVSGGGSAADGAAGVLPTGNSGSSADGMTAIEIPRRAAEGLPAPAPAPLSPLTPGASAAEEARSPAAARLRTLRRLLITGSRGLGSPCSPRGRDIEQGSPKAPSSS